MSSVPLATSQLLAPHHGPGACPRCLNLVDRAGPCRACRATEQHLAVIVPISYSVGGEWLHRLIISYKRDADRFVQDALAAITTLLDQFISRHECCLAAAVLPATGVGRSFDLITTVPSADPLRDLHHPLRGIVGSACPTTRDRYERLLFRSDSVAIPRVYDPARYVPARRLDGEGVLLIDDMWTSGASAESAAGALIAAGAGTVAAIVIARHLNRHWHDNDAQITRLAETDFNPDRCVICSRDRHSEPPREQRQSLASALQWQT